MIARTVAFDGAFVTIGIGWWGGAVCSHGVLLIGPRESAELALL